MGERERERERWTEGRIYREGEREGRMGGGKEGRRGRRQKGGKEEKAVWESRKEGGKERGRTKSKERKHDQSQKFNQTNVLLGFL